MTQRTRHHEDAPVTPDTPAATTGGSPPALFSRAQTLKARMLDALDRRTSEDSQKFVRQLRQHGGQ